MNNKITSELKLPAVGLGLMFFAGCFAGSILSRNAGIILTAVVCVLALVSFIARRGRVWAVGLLLGLVSITSYLQFYVQPLEDLSGSEIRAEFRIVSQNGSYPGWSSSTAVCSIDGCPAVVYLNGNYQADIGDSVDALVTLGKARQNAYTFSDGIVLSGDVKQVYSTRSNFSLLYFAELFRNAAAERLDGLGGDEAELCKGLLLGRTDGFSLRLRRDITYSGVNYMTAVSGAHITLCIAILTELFGRDRRRLCAWLSIASVALLAVLFGFAPSVMRAGFMLILLNCGALFCRKADTLNSLCVSLLLLTVFTPYAAADPALQMSALGVFGAAVLGTALNNLRKFQFERFRLLALIKKAAVMSLGAMVCIAPVSVSLFGGISLAEIPASVVLSPFFAAALILGALMAVSGVPLMIVPLKGVMICFRWILGFFGEIDGAWLAMDFPAAVPLAALTAFLLIIAAFVPDHSKLALSSFALSLVLTICVSIFSAQHRRRIDFVSDGSSGAAVLCSRNEAAVIISGSGGGLSYQLYNEFIRSGITRIRLINAPQLDSSGINAISELTELFPADSLLCGEELIPLAQGLCSGAGEIKPAAEVLSIDGKTIACAKSGSDIEADIALYYGYTMKEPESRAALALYASSRQNVLPEGGINIYDEVLRIDLAATE